MSLKILEAARRCGKCKINRAQRYCPRLGKDICWECCVELKVDRKCPAECIYQLRDDLDPSTTEKGGMVTKVESVREHQTLTKRLIDEWIVTPSPLFNNKIPLEMARKEEHREELRSYLNKIAQQPLIPTDYLSKKFNLAIETTNQMEDTYEEVAEEYLNLLLLREWEKSARMLTINEHYNDQLFRSNYQKRRSENKTLNKTTSYKLLLSAISESKDEALVYFELNGKQDLTIVLSAKPEKWRIQELILGSPNLFYNEGEAVKMISNLVASGKVEEAKDLLDKYSAILIDSPDIHYLFGLHYLILRNYPIAEGHYLNAVELDPNFAEYKYNLALAYHMNRNIKMAKRFYEETLELRPEDANTLNNLSVIYEAEGDIAKTVELLEKCLSIDPNSEMARKNLDRIKNKK